MGFVVTEFGTDADLGKPDAPTGAPNLQVVRS
jgi:hypothetical protein